MMIALALLCLVVSFVAGIFAYGKVIPDNATASNASVVFILSLLAFMLFGLIGLIPPDNPEAQAGAKS
jgi:hypothetical protein